MKNKRLSSSEVRQGRTEARNNGSSFRKEESRKKKKKIRVEQEDPRRVFGQEQRGGVPVGSAQTKTRKCGSKSLYCPAEKTKEKRKK